MKKMRAIVGKEEEIFPKGSRVEVTSNEEGFTGAWYVATVLATPSSKSPPSKNRSRTPEKRQTTQMYLVEYENLLTDDNPSKPLSEYVDVSFMRPVQPTADGDAAVAGDDGRYGFQVNDVVDVNLRDGLWTGVVKGVVVGGSKFLVQFENPPDEVECSGSDLRIHLNWVDREWVRPDKQETNKPKDEERQIRKKRGRSQESLDKFSKGARKGEKSGIAAAAGAQKKIVASNVGSLEGKKHDIAAGALNQIVVKNVRISTRLRKDIFWSDSFYDFPSWISNKECLKLIADSKRFLSAARYSNSTRKLGESKCEQLNLNVAQNRGERLPMILFEEPLDKITSVNNGSPIQDPLDASNGKSSEVDNLDSGARDATDVIDDEMPIHILEERALLTWFDGMEATTPMNNGVSNGRAIEVNTESSERQDHTVTRTLFPAMPTQSPAVNTESSDRQNHTVTRTPFPAMPTQSPAVFVNCENTEESQTIPFKKLSPVWKSIESMEVFQKTPQRPHFSPLVKCREDYREGLAVGHMVTFANLVEKTLSLQVSHPQSIIESSLETLKELEDHGFDVLAIQNRLAELQSLKDKVGKLEDSSKEAEDEILKLNQEKKELEELMDKVEMKMRQIKEKLVAAASMKETKVKQINVLQSKVNFFADSLESTKSDFERIATSPL